MIYGLYLSASGVLANSYRQDVIANNLANAETVGFKKDLAVFQEQQTESARRGLNPARHSNLVLEGLGGGLGAMPMYVDHSQGELEPTGGPLDVAIQGEGYFAVRHRGRRMLTRDGRFLADREGYLIQATTGAEVLDSEGQPIKLNPGLPAQITPDGAITQNNQAVARLGTFTVNDPRKLIKHGSGLMESTDPRSIRPGDAALRTGFVERSNVEPTRELVALLDAQRQLEANANMIRYQDQTLGRLVNDVGKIG